MSEKIKLNQVVVVEGKYDAIKLDSILDRLIIPVNGFSVYNDDDKKNLLKNLGKKNGIVLVTDSDTAGFKIRNYIENICKGCDITNVYIPTVKGKEPRKSSPSKEGFLGVEGINRQTLRKCFEDANLVNNNLSIQLNRNSEPLTFTDLYQLGLSGTDNASQNRKRLSAYMNIPEKLSKKALLEVLNRMSNREEIENILYGKPVLFWDFHGTLTKPDNQWMDIAIKLCDTHFPHMNISHEDITKNLSGKCLPWWTYPDRDTRHLIDDDGWWRSCENEFVKMYVASGLEKAQAEQIASLIRPYVVDSANHRLHDDALSVLAQLKDRGYRNYILSNNFPELDDIVQKLGLGEYFDGCIVSALVGFDKPRKEIFEYGAQLSGNNGRYVMIGDNPDDDMKGAKLCGFETILVNNRYPDYSGEYCDHICKTLTDILQVLK